MILNTGYDHAAATTYQPITPDGYWELVDAPNQDLSGDGFPDAPGTSTTLSMPSPPWVIYPHPAWATFPDSQWISAYNTSSLNTNNPPQHPSNATLTYAPYTFQRCFCTCKGVESIRLDLKVLVDNDAKITLDGVPLATTPSDDPINFQKGVEIKQDVAVNPGKHCLRVEVRNVSGVAMGLNVNGTATSVPSGQPLFLSASCCSPVGKIIGRKFHDMNCNGKNDNEGNNQSIEPGLPGWTITLTNTGNGSTTSTTTDANGFYYFNNLSPGTYTVSESLQGGWSQSIPGGSGTYTVTVAAGQIIQRDFGNCKKTLRACAQVNTVEITCGRGTAGSYTFAFSVTNNSGKDVHQILLTPPVGSTFTLSQQVFNLSTPLQNGQSTTLTVNIGNVKPGERVCFLATLMSRDGPCCTVEVCPVLPVCCGRITDEVAASPLGGFDYTFTVFNQSTNPIENIYLTPPVGVTMTPSYIAATPAIAPGTSRTFTVKITGATPGTRVCFNISLHSPGMKECCSFEHCVRLPDFGQPK